MPAFRRGILSSSSWWKMEAMCAAKIDYRLQIYSAVKSEEFSDTFHSFTNVTSCII